MERVNGWEGGQGGGSSDVENAWDTRRFEIFFGRAALDEKDREDTYLFEERGRIIQIFIPEETDALNASEDLRFSRGCDGRGTPPLGSGA